METIVLITKIKWDNTCKLFRPTPGTQWGCNKNIVFIFINPLIFREDQKTQQSRQKMCAYHYAEAEHAF